jgi:hypothetical protein
MPPLCALTMTPPGSLPKQNLFAPHLVGIGLYTRWVWHAYRLAEQMLGRFPMFSKVVQNASFLKMTPAHSVSKSHVGGCFQGQVFMNRGLTKVSPMQGFRGSQGVVVTNAPGFAAAQGRSHLIQQSCSRFMIV